MKMKSRKRSQSNKDDQDMISNLPECILARILSSLPTKDAVRTSVLSKSWINRWTFITDLRFEDTWRYSSRIVKKNFFLSFVYRVLLHLNSTSIQSFSLTLSEKYESCHVDQWISAVISRRVKKICVNSNKELALSSHSLLKYKSLEHLVLSRGCCCDIRVPPFACFSSLTVLHLCEIKFIGDTSNNSGKILLHFPVLRTYKIVRCTWSPSLKYVTLEAPLLEVVLIDNSPPSKDDCPYPTIKFCASRLREFTYYGYPLPVPIVFELSAAHIVSATIGIGLYKNGSLQELMALSSKFLKQFHNVECLKFQSWNKVMLAKDSLVNLPAFEMLAHLELGKVTGEILVALLLRTPYLKTLDFLELLQSDEELSNCDGVPDCFLNTLQEVKFNGLDGSEHQLSFAKFVMENAVALKRMSCSPIWDIRGSNLEEVKEKLISLKKCSSLNLEFSTGRGCAFLTGSFEAQIWK